MERRGPAARDACGNRGGRGAVIKAPIDLQDLSRGIYAGRKVEPSGPGGVGGGRGPTAESAAALVGPISLGVKRAGERSAGNPPAPFDVAGVGNVARGAGLRPPAKAVDSPPDPPGSAFPWAYSPVSGLADYGCFSQGTPASRVDQGVTSSRAPSLHGHYPASALLRTHPSPSRRRPTSRGRRFYGLPSFRGFRRGTRRASPVARCVLVAVLSLTTPPE